MTYVTSSVKQWLFQFDLDGLFHTSFKPAVSCVQDVYIAVLEGQRPRHKQSNVVYAVQCSQDCNAGLAVSPYIQSLF